MQEAQRRGLPVVGDIELFAREAEAPIAAVTGTNGKSTVTTLVATLANAGGRRALAGGNLGEPALDLLEQPLPELYVLELSSFQLETTHSLRTATATVLNVTPDHMDRYATLEDYAAAKARIFDGCAVAVVNLDDAAVRVDAATRASRCSSFSLVSRDADYTLEQRAGADDRAARRATAAAAPTCACRACTTPPMRWRRWRCAKRSTCRLAPALEALASFAGLPHRSQWVADVAGVHYVNDSKGTNVGATLAAVAGMSGPLVVIAGGDGKNQDFSGVARGLPRQGAARRADRPRRSALGRDARRRLQRPSAPPT